jgi:hypothetical protein
MENKKPNKETDRQILSAFKERDSFKKAKLKRKKSKKSKK